MLFRSDDWPYARVMQTFPRLAEREAHLGGQLSGGEQQMLSIGRALMTHPDLVILDEATEGLAPLIVAEIWRVIGEIRASGIATLIVDRDYRKVSTPPQPRQLVHTALRLQQFRVAQQRAVGSAGIQPHLHGFERCAHLAGDGALVNAQQIGDCRFTLQPEVDIEKRELIQREQNDLANLDA